MGLGANQGSITLWSSTDLLIESDDQSRIVDIPLATEITIFGRSLAANPGESRVTLYTGIREWGLAEDLVLDVFDGLTVATDFDQGDAFALMFFLPSNLNRKLIKFNADAAAGSRFTVTDETSDAPVPMEFIRARVETDTNAGSYAHDMRVIVKN